MLQTKKITLSQMTVGQTGTVLQITGGQGISRRLEAMGIRHGKKITKVNAMLFRGPITVLVDRSQVALGLGMADRIILEVETGAPQAAGTP